MSDELPPIGTHLIIDGIHAADCWCSPLAAALDAPAPLICAACGGTNEPVVMVPLHPRCTDAPAPQALDVAVTALLQIKREEGKVCDQYEICEHRSCQSSYGAWAIADRALARLSRLPSIEGLTDEERDAFMEAAAPPQPSAPLALDVERLRDVLDRMTSIAQADWQPMTRGYEEFYGLLAEARTVLSRLPSETGDE